MILRTSDILAVIYFVYFDYAKSFKKGDNRIRDKNKIRIGCAHVILLLSLLIYSQNDQLSGAAIEVYRVAPPSFPASA